MTKAEEAALKAYPVKEEWVGNQYGDWGDINESFREKYKEGYERAEKDTVKKAIEWIKYNNENGGCSFDGWEMDFRKYMEDEKWLKE